MPQGSLFGDEQMTKLSIELRLDEIKQRTTMQLIARSRAGDVLSSASINLIGFRECEEAPIAVYEACLGFLFKSPKDAVNAPMRSLKDRIKSLRSDGGPSAIYAKKGASS